MALPLARPATPDGLFLWVMHRFAEVFEDHAIIKGGIALRLLDCPRSTTDIDYVFVPYRSKKGIMRQVESVLSEIEGANVTSTLHSKMLRVTIELDSAAIQVELNVDMECPAIAVPTGELAIDQGQPSRIVRVMALDRALAAKLAAWNERRLLRDLYDCYFLAGRLAEMPDMDALDARLGKIESRLPRLKKRKSMSRAEFGEELRHAAEALTEPALREELGGILPPDELVGLVPRIRSAVIKIAELVERS